MNYELSQKAWELNLFRIYDPYHLSEIIRNGKTRGEAKSKIYQEAMNEDLSLTDEKLTFLNIPIRRCKRADLYFFEGKEVTLEQIEKIEKEKIRIIELDKILNDESIVYCYIRKGSYYRPNSCGYTDFRHRAGVYTKQEAVSSAKSCKDLDIVPINIEEHNSIIQKEIDELKTRVLEAIS